MRGKIICLLVAMFALVATVWAEGNSPLSKALQDFNGHSRSGRVQHAQNFLALINAIKSGLPLLKPSESEWIMKERAEIERLNSGSDRWARLYLFSPEYQHQQLENALQQMKEAAECVIDDKVIVKREMFCWAVMVYYASSEDWERWIRITQEAKRLSLSNLGEKPPVPSIFASMLVGFGREIQSDIIIPYLRGDVFTK